MARSCGLFKHSTISFGILALVTVLFALCFSKQCFASSPITLRQYAHTAWRTQEGTFSGTASSLAQTSDGYIWIGTSLGILRFDGVHFTPWDPDPKHRLSHGIHSLLGTHDGSLWIGTGQNAFKWKNQLLTSYDRPGGRINDLLEARDGAVWLVRTRSSEADGPLCRMDLAQPRCFGASDGVTCKYSSTLAEDSERTIWFGSSDAMCAMAKKGARSYPLEGLEHNSLTGVDSTTAVDGALLVGLSQTGHDLGLRELRDGKWSAAQFSGLDTSTLSLESSLVDVDGSLWLGSSNRGIYHVVNGVVDHFGTESGLSGDEVNRIFQDSEGNVWVATGGGIDQFHKLPIVSYSTREGLNSDAVSAVLALQDGSVLAHAGGLDLLRDGKVSHLTQQIGLRAATLSALFQDHAGTIWLGVNEQFVTYAQNKFRVIPRPAAIDIAGVLQFAEDAKHDIWVRSASRPQRLIRIHDARSVEEVNLPTSLEPTLLATDPAGRMWVVLNGNKITTYENNSFKTQPTPAVSAIQGLIISEDGTILVGSVSQGIHAWHDGHWLTLDTHNGLPCNAIFGMARDSSKSLWLNMTCGFAKISADDLNRWLQKPDGQVPAKLYDVFDGAQPGSTTFSPAFSQSPDGRLWIATDSLLHMIDPAQVQSNPRAPPVHIEEFFADRQPLSKARGAYQLPALTREVQINYTGLSFVTPQKVYFRYRMTGVDKDWQDVGTRRQAFYMNLGPGSYVFQVMACNNDGVWNLQGDSVSFSIAPAVYQTLWFRILCALCVLLAIWGLFLYRLNLLGNRIQDNLAARFEERLRISRDLHDTLLQGVYGITMGFQIVMDRVSGNDEAKKKLDEMLHRADNTLSEARQRLQSLRAHVEPNDLASSFKLIAEEHAALSTTVFHITEKGTPVPLNAVVWDESYWIGKEALANAFHHAHAEHIEIAIEYGRKELHISFSDDGVGIPDGLGSGVRTDHWGMAGMRERAKLAGGRLTLTCIQPHGTKVQFLIAASLAYAPSHQMSFWRRLMPFRSIASKFKKSGAV